MKKYRGLLLALLLPATLLAYSSPGKPMGFVNDFAGALKTETKTQLEEKLLNFSRESGNELAVAIISRLDNETIETYAVKLFEEWGIGKAKEDNGLLLLVALENRELRIEVGYGLEPIITDLESARIIREVIVPEFQKGDYDTGIIKGIDRLISDIQEGVPPLEKKSSVPPGNLIYPALILLMIFASILGRSKSWWAGGVIGGVAGIIIAFIKGFVLTGIVALAVLIPLGLLFDFWVSRSYQKHKSLGSTPWWLGGGRGGSGFGGFGGGMSGGGGASGRW